MARIDGVEIKKLTTFPDQRGFFREVIRVSDDFFGEGFGQWSHTKSYQGVVKAWVDIGPAMGMIGTLIGLVLMLGNMSDVKAIGPAMAVALLTTLYGALLAHTLFTPLAERLAARFASERLGAELQLVAVMAIAERDNPRRLEATLNGLLAPEDRVSRFDR